MAEEEPPKPEGSWGNMRPPDYFQQPPGYVGAPGPSPNYGARVDFAAIGRAWQIISSDMGTWVVASLIIMIISYAINMAITLPFQLMMSASMNSMVLQSRPGGPAVFDWTALVGFYAITIFAAFLVQGLVLTLVGGMMDMAVRRMEGLPVSIGDMFVGFKHFGSFLVVGIAVAVLSMVAFVLCIIPMFIVAGLSCFAPLLIIRGHARGLAAVSMSWQILKYDLVMISLLVFVAQLLSGLGALACCVGALFTYSIYPITIALTYCNFFPPTTQPGSGVESPSNYFRG
jgi:hypothetical protein